MCQAEQAFLQGLLPIGPSGGSTLPDLRWA